jgi:hypothetical protein
MVKKTNKFQDISDKSKGSLFFEKTHSRRRCKSASDEKMISGGSFCSENDAMNVSPVNFYMLNSRKTYSEMHPVTQTLLNKMISAIVTDLKNINPGDQNSENIVHKIVYELSLFGHSAQTQTIRDPLV